MDALNKAKNALNLLYNRFIAKDHSLANTIYGRELTKILNDLNTHQQTMDDLITENEISVIKFNDENKRLKLILEIFNIDVNIFNNCDLLFLSEFREYQIKHQRFAFINDTLIDLIRIKSIGANMIIDYNTSELIDYRNELKAGNNWYCQFYESLNINKQLTDYIKLKPNISNSEIKRQVTKQYYEKK